MKKCFFILLLLSLLSAKPLFAQTPLTLEECYRLALQMSEDIAIKAADIEVAEQKYAEAIGRIVPNIHFNGREFLQDDSANTQGAGSVGSTLTRFSTPSLAFNAKQPLFQGLRELNGLKSLKAQRRATQAQLEHAERLLFLDVVNAFYTLIQIEQEEQILLQGKKTLETRLKDLKYRTSVGRSRVSDELNTEASLANHEALLAEIEGNLNNAREVLAFLIHKPAKEVVVTDPFMKAHETRDEEEVTRNIEIRPDVIAAREIVNSSHSQLNVQKGNFFPTINAEANYYPYRVGFLEPIKWDALFTLDIPLFTGGQNKSKMQEAKIQMKQAELQLVEQKRQANSEINRAYNSFMSAQKQVEAFETANVKGAANYQAVAQDYSYGITNNIEVLQVLVSWENIRRNYVRALALDKMSYYNLKVAAGDKIP